MRLTAPHGRAILRGDITARLYTTRNRPYHPGDTTPLQYPQTVTDSYNQPVRTTDGQPRLRFATQTALRIDNVRHTALADIELYTCRCLGHPTIDHFRDAFDLEHNHRHDPDHDGPVRTRPLKLTRQVWIVYFTLEHLERVNLLARTGDPYTTSTVIALPDEPEAIDPELIATLPASQQAHARWAMIHTRRRQEYDQLPIAEKIMRLQQLADEHRIDITGPMRDIERALDRASRRLPRAA